MNRKSVTRVLAVVLAAGTLGPATAWAQSDAPPPADPMGSPLGGPEVKDRDVPGVAGSFGNDAEGQRRKFADRVPARAMREAIGVVMSENAPEDIRATPEQREKIRACYEEFQKSLRDFVRDHREELEDLRAKMPRGGAGGGAAGGGPAGELFRILDRPGDRRRRGDESRSDRAPQAQPTDSAAPPAEAKKDQPRRRGEGVPVEVREQLRALAEQMPKIDDVYTKIWAELTPEQRKAVDGRLDEFRQKQAREREDEYVQRRVKTKGGGPADGKPDGPPPPRRRPADGARIGPGGPPPPPAPNANISPERRERLMRIFERMTPEQQDQLLSRLEARLRGGGGGDGGAGVPPPPPSSLRRRAGRPGPSEPPPVPDAEHMPVPPPPPPAPPPPPPQPDEMTAPPR